MTGKAKPAVDVDARGLACPEPVLRLRAALRAVAPGTHVRMLASDPLAAVDVKAYCLRSGHALVSERAAGGEWEFVVAKKGTEVIKAP